MDTQRRRGRPPRTATVAGTTGPLGQPVVARIDQPATAPATAPASDAAPQPSASAEDQPTAKDPTAVLDAEAIDQAVASDLTFGIEPGSPADLNEKAVAGTVKDGGGVVTRTFDE